MWDGELAMGQAAKTRINRVFTEQSRNFRLRVAFFMFLYSNLAPSPEINFWLKAKTR